MMRLMLRCVFIGILIQTITISAKPPDWVTEEMIAMVAGDKERCMSEHGTTEDLIDEVNNGNLSNDPRITCYMYCLFDSFSMIDDDGTLETDMLLEILPPKIQGPARDILPKCAQQEGGDNCERIYKILDCIKQQNKDYLFAI